MLKRVAALSLLIAGFSFADGITLTPKASADQSFDVRKQLIIKLLETREKTIQTGIKCIDDSKNNAAMTACLERMKESMKNEHPEKSGVHSKLPVKQSHTS